MQLLDPHVVKLAREQEYRSALEERKRREKRYLVRVFPFGANSVVLGHRVKPNAEGAYEMEVFESELPELEKHVEDMTQYLDLAEANCEKAKELHAKNWKRQHGQASEPPRMALHTPEHEFRLIAKRSRRKLKGYEVVRELPLAKAGEGDGVALQLLEAIRSLQDTGAKRGPGRPRKEE